MDPFIPLIAKRQSRNKVFSRNDILSNACSYQQLCFLDVECSMRLTETQSANNGLYIGFRFGCAILPKIALHCAIVVQYLLPLYLSIGENKQKFCYVNRVNRGSGMYRM